MNTYININKICEYEYNSMFVLKISSAKPGGFYLLFVFVNKHAFK